MPAKPSTVANFLASLSEEKLSSATAKLYLSAVSNYHKEHGHLTPTRHSAVQAVLRGFCRKAPQLPDKRLPISLDVMRFMKTQIASSHLSRFDQHVVWFAFTLAFFGFLRVCELTTVNASSFDADRCLRFRDIYVSPTNSHLTVIIRRSKSDQNGFGHQVALLATNRSVCPVRACQKFFALLPNVNWEQSNSPVLSFRDGKFLTQSCFQRLLKTFLKTYPNGHRFSSHSFRIGAATAAAVKGHHPDSIKAAGRWKSNAYQGYIRKEVPCPTFY